MDKLTKGKVGAWAALIAGATFGLNSIVVKAANNSGLTTIDLLIYQMIIPLLYFAIKYYMNKKPNNKRKDSMLKNKYNWLAGFTVVFTSLFYYSAIQETDPSIASLGLFQYPWILLLLGFFVNKEFLKFSQIVSVFFIWVGTVLLISGALEQITVLGMIFGLGAGISFALYMFSLQKISNHSGTKLLIFAIGAMIASLFTIIQFDQANIFSLNAIGFGLLTALLGQIITFELLAFAAKNTSSVFMATLTTSELPVAMLLTWILWGPFPSLLKITGLLIMISAIVWLKLDQTLTSKNSMRIKKIS